MSEEEIVLYTKVDGVARIVIKRPSKLNALNKAVIHGIHRAIVNAEGDPEVRCVLLTGAGDAFSSGGDLEMVKQFATQSPPEIYQSLWRRFEDILKIYSLANP